VIRGKSAGPEPAGNLPAGLVAGGDPGSALERLARVAASWYAAPITLIRLNSVCFPSLAGVYGPAGDWTRREISICAHTFSSEEPLVVPDLRKHTEYGASLLVTGASGIRFYAAWPIRGPKGEFYGTVCVLDRRPRHLNRKKLKILADVAHLAARVLTEWLSSTGSPRPLVTFEADEQRYRALFENATDIVYVHDLRGRLTAVNGTMERMTGFSREELLTMEVSELVVPEHREVISRMVLEQFGGGVSQNYELDFLTRGGQPFSLEVSGHLLFEQGRPVGLLGFGRDVTSRKKEANALLNAEKKLDETAGLLESHRLQLEELHRLTTSAHENRQAAFDDYVAAGCRMLGLPTGILAEIREDSCVIVACESPDTGVERGLTVPQRQTCFAGAVSSGKTHWYRRKRPIANRSIIEPMAAGFLTCTPIYSCDRLFGILCFADRAPHSSTATKGKKKIVEVLASGLGNFLMAEELRTGRKRARTANTGGRGLRRALENKEFKLRFQPEVTPDGAVVALEALLSWPRPKRGHVPASLFIPAAEETGLIVPIGSWVLSEACRSIATWRKKAPAPVRIAVNVSAVQFERPDFVDLVARTLAAHGADASLLELEITESAVLHDIKHSAGTILRLRDLGVSVCLDDFGTGYSSLSYLHQLPVNILKIDRSFLVEAHQTNTALHILRTITRLAHRLNLLVVGEGVETEAQLDLIRRAGCDRFQGHLFGRPVSAATAAKLVRSGRKLIPSRRRGSAHSA